MKQAVDKLVPCDKHIKVNNNNIINMYKIKEETFKTFLRVEPFSKRRRIPAGSQVSFQV